MKKYILLTSLCIAGICYAEDIVAPDWVGQVDSILASVQGMEEMLVNDTQLYLDLNVSLEGMFGDFDRREEERVRLFAAVKEKVKSLQNQLVLAETNSAEAITAKDITIRDLESTIIAIKFATQAEIDRLANIIDNLSKELQATREAYATLIDMNGEKAEALISQLTDIKNAYGSMLDSRKTFLATLDRFINRTRAYLAKGSADSKELGVEIAGAGFLTTNQPSTPAPAINAEEAVAPEAVSEEVSISVEVATPSETTPEESVQQETVAESVSTDEVPAQETPQVSEEQPSTN